MLICSHCGKLCEEEDAIYNDIQYEIQNGVKFKFAQTEEYRPCSYCGGEYVEAKRCKICGDYFNDEGEGLDICEDCIEEAQTVDIALKIGEENMEDVKINGFIRFALTPEQINDILCKAIHNNPKIADYSGKVVDYCEEDRSYFSEWLEEHNGV